MKRFFIMLAMCLGLSATASAQDAVSSDMSAVPTSTAQLQMSFAPLVKKTSPAVVNIYAKILVREKMRVISPFFNDPFFNQFFNVPRGQVRERVENSLGSGVIVGPNGTVATNTHVVKNATEIIVVTADGREFKAEKKLVDEQTDLAILQIDPKGENLPFLPLADSDALEVGDIVLAIGNPFGVGQTVTSGIISGLARTGVGPSGFGAFIQTDAAINPGNSGGALIDMQGRLVGINSMIFSRDGGSLGIGFAIPANLLKTVVDASRTDGRIVRPWTGFGGQSVTSDMIESLGLERATGVLVYKISKGSPADKAGMQVGDIILSVNGHDVRDPASLQFRITTIPIGSDMAFVVLRNGKRETLSIKAIRPPEVPPRQQTDLKGRHPFSGATVANISPAVSEELGGIHEDSGVVVIEGGKGNALRLGLRAGDTILKVNDVAISSVDHLLKTLAKPSGGRWAVEIGRDGKRFNYLVTGG